MDIAFTQQDTSKVGPIEKPLILESLRQAKMGSSIMKGSKKYTNSSFKVVPLTPVIFKCHWFDPTLTRRTPNVGLVKIRQDSKLPGDDHTSLLSLISVPNRQTSSGLGCCV